MSERRVRITITKRHAEHASKKESEKPPVNTEFLLEGIELDNIHLRTGWTTPELQQRVNAKRATEKLEPYMMLEVNNQVSILYELKYLLKFARGTEASQYCVSPTGYEYVSKLN